jgi:hypothetical protein
VLLKTKVARWKVCSLIGISKNILVHHSLERLAYYSRYTIGKEELRLESHCYNKSWLGPTLNISPRLDGHKPFLVVSNPYLTFLSSTCCDDCTLKKDG